MLRIRRIGRVRLTTLKRLSRLLIFLMIMMRFHNRHQRLMIVSRRHRPLNQILSSGQLSSARYLTQPQYSSCPYSAGAINCVNPTFARLTLMMVSRKSVRTMQDLCRFLTLLRAFVLRVRAVLRRSLFRRLKSIVRYSVRRSGPHRQCHRVRGGIRQRHMRPHLRQVARRPCKRRWRNGTTRRQMRSLPPNIRFRVFLNSNTSANGTSRRRHNSLTMRRITIIVSNPPFSASIGITRCTTPIIRRNQISNVLRGLRRCKSVRRHARCPMGSLWFLTLFRYCIGSFWCPEKHKYRTVTCNCRQGTNERKGLRVRIWTHRVLRGPMLPLWASRKGSKQRYRDRGS